jgi:hypothetical protein
VTEREGGDLAYGARGITIFAVPYDSGYRGLRMGAGPEHLLSNGMEGVLAATGREIRSEVLQPTSTFRAEIATAFELCGMIAKRVHEAMTAMGVSGRKFPSSIEDLLRRAFKGGEPLRINPLVDFYNVVSLWKAT